MTYPQPGGYQPPAPQYPQQPPAPQYAPPQPPAYGYPPQQGGYPAQAPQGYAAPQQPYGYPPAQQGYPAAPPQAPQTPVSASLSDFYNQPSTGWGPSITPTGATPDGTQIIMVVAQHITKAHIEHKDEFRKPGVKAYYTNGQPKLSMKVPVNVAVGSPYWGEKGMQTVDDGRAQFYLQGSNKDLVGAAIAAAGGNPAEPPELGAVIIAVKTHNRRNNSGTDSAVVTFQYLRPGPEAMQFAAQCGISAYPDLSTPKPVETGGEPGGNAAPPAPSAGPTVQQQAAPPPPVMPQPPMAPQMPAPQQFASPTGAGATVPPPAPQGLPVAAPPAAPGAPAGLSPDKAALLASLTGGAPVAPPAA